MRKRSSSVELGTLELTRRAITSSVTLAGLTKWPRAHSCRAQHSDRSLRPCESQWPRRSSPDIYQGAFSHQKKSNALHTVAARTSGEQAVSRTLSDVLSNATLRNTGFWMQTPAGSTRRRPGHTAASTSSTTRFTTGRGNLARAIRRELTIRERSGASPFTLACAVAFGCRRLTKSAARCLIGRSRHVKRWRGGQMLLR